LDKALEYEEKSRAKEEKEQYYHRKKLDDITKKEFYRDVVK
jgi:hypothetical protein